MHRDVTGYQFTEFSTELDNLETEHPHKVSRQAEVILRDEFAHRTLMDIAPTLYEQDLEGWARSFYTKQDHLHAIMLYSTNDTPITALKQDCFNQAILAVQNELCSLPRVKAFDVQTELDLIKYEQSSAAGYNYVGPKGPIDGDNHKRAIRLAKATLWSMIRDEDGGPAYIIKNSVPDVGYTRTQLTDLREKTKVRGVWGRAFHYILLEGLFARPLLDAISSGHSFIHIGTDPKWSVPDLLSNVSRDCRWLFAIDWSGFDSSVSRFEIETAFDMIKKMIVFPNYETEQAYELCRLLFIHKKIAAPDGQTYWSHRGIPSGSYFTSIIGSVVNRLRIEYLWRILTNQGPKMCYTQGDDSLIGNDYFVSPNELAKIADPLGWKINPDKTQHSTSPEFITFLGRTNSGVASVRERKRCLRLLIYPEYPVENGKISAFRAKSIADDCGGISSILNTIALKLKRRYGLATESEVPSYFRRYIP